MRLSIRLYVDEHVPRAVVNGLRARGADVLTPHEASMLGASDEDQIGLAASTGRVLVTQEADMLRLHAAGVQHAGIIYTPQGTAIGDFIRGTMLVVDVLGPDEMVRHIEFA